MLEIFRRRMGGGSDWPYKLVFLMPVRPDLLDANYHFETVAKHWCVRVAAVFLCVVERRGGTE